MAQDRFASLKTMKIGPAKDHGSGTEPTAAPEPAVASTIATHQPNPAPPPTPPPTSALAVSPAAAIPSNGPRPKASPHEIPKRNNPAYQQINTYIPKAVHQLVWLELVKQSPRGQFDVLVEDLLKHWLKGKGITTSLDGNPI